MLLNGLAAGCIYGLIALGFVLIYKATEMVNFAQGDLLMLGAFVAFTLIEMMGFNYWLAFIGAVLFMAVFGYVLDTIVLRQVIGQPQFAVVMLTIGLGFIFRAAASMIWGTETRAFATPFTDGVTRIGGFVIADVNVSIVVGTALLCAALYAFFRYTRIGIAMQAASQNQLAAYYMGIPVKMIFSLIWAISAGVAAVAGILLAPVALIDVTIGLLGLKAFAAAVLGGFGSIPGAVIGGLVIGVIEQFSGVYMAEGFKDVAAYVVILAVLFLRPQGLFGNIGRKRV
ncbi:branched-chain amino acid ABC transporter permease [uncultured Ferrovibrio sp.]|uniref:branched-chain amino acid ABC transporter permease n=1 Tax=uncultured Ferrovibrio sp. TaxID=1576913 RepID=UPI0026254A99|nr:branched-chain amino acid ABC transporter permease [uncultured Ferrovibrio sp.]